LKRNGVKIILHVCDDTTDRLESLTGTGLDGVSLDEPVDFGEGRRMRCLKYCIMGNVSTTLMALGQAAQVYQATHEVIDKAGKSGSLLVSGGSILLEMCPPENMRAMIQATRESDI
jgi:uroporphyrinogen-III decarboxylase